MFLTGSFPVSFSLYVCVCVYVHICLPKDILMISAFLHRDLERFTLLHLNRGLVFYASELLSSFNK